MNHAGRNPAAGQDGAPARRHDHADRAGASRPSSRISRKSPGPRPRSSKESSRAAMRCSTATTGAASCWKRWRRAAGVEHVDGFGENARAEYPADQMRAACRPFADLGAGSAARRSSSKSVRPAGISCRTCWQCSARRNWSARTWTRWPRRWPTSRPESGRGARHLLEIRNGTFTLIDESYNANPASMRAAIELLAATPGRGRGAASRFSATCWNSASHAPKLHAGLADRDHRAPNTDMVFLGGPEMEALADSACRSNPCRIQAERGRIASRYC